MKNIIIMAAVLSLAGCSSWRQPVPVAVHEQIPNDSKESFLNLVYVIQTNWDARDPIKIKALTESAKNFARDARMHRVCSKTCYLAYENKQVIIKKSSIEIIENGKSLETDNAEFAADKLYGA